MSKRVMRRVVSVVAVSALYACSVQAADESAAVQKRFIEQFPQRTVEAVRETPVKGIYEITLPARQIVYTDAAVKHMFVGELIDLDKRESLTDQRVSELSKVDWSQLPLELAIKDVRGDGSRRIAVFSDPDCPFCKRLEKESFANLDNVTIYTFLYPIEQLHPQAMARSAKIWCASDRLATWRNVMVGGKAIPDTPQCDTPLERLQELGLRLGIHGTPALIFADGRIVPGAIPKSEVEKRLSARP